MTRQVANSERTVKFWRYYAVFSALTAAAIALPAITTIPLEQDSLREIARDAAVTTVEAAAKTLGVAYASGKTADLQQQVADVLRTHPTIVSAVVTGWTGKVVAASDPKQEGKLLIDLFPPPVSAAAQWIRRDNGTEAIEVTVPLQVNGELRGALRAQLVPPPVKTERWTEIGKMVALTGALLGFLALAGIMRLRRRERPRPTVRPRPLPSRSDERQQERSGESRREEKKEPMAPKDEVLHVAMDLLPLALIIVDDVSGVVVFANRTFCRLWAAEHLAERLRRRDVLYDEIAAHCRAQAGGTVPPLPERRVTSLDPDTDAVEIPCADGRLVRRFSIPFSTEAGGKLVRVYAFEDLTSSQGALNDLSRARDAADQALRLKAEFLATITREVRASLNGLIGTLGLLSETSLNAQQGKYADAARESAESLLGLVNGVHDLSRIEAGTLQPAVADFDLRRLLHDTVASSAEAAQRKGIEIMCSADPHLPRSVKGDAERLRRVLSVLVSNAVHFTERGEIIVRVTVGENPAVGAAGLHIASDGSRKVRSQSPCPQDELVTVRFEVQDTGAGIAPERQAQLFEVAAPAAQSPRERTRMSLAVAKRLVEFMGGDVGVESEPGRGSTFWFSLPLQPQEQARVRPERAAPEEAITKARVLIVDDNATARALLEQQLRAWRITSESAANASEALKRLLSATHSGTPYSLAIIDAHMPEMDGLSLAQAIAREPKLAETPLFLLTAAGAQLPPLAERPRIVATLPKPVRPSPLYDSLVNLLVRPPAAEVEAPPATAVPPPAAAPPAGRLLLAEDNLINQRIALRMLERLGYQTDVVVNGQQAVEAALTEHYDAILMDCQMPEMDGLTATEIIREHEGNERHTPIIAITANAVEGDRERCIEAGMDDYLAKPVKVAELAETLGRWVHRNGSSTNAAIANDAAPTRSGVAGAAA